MVFFRQRRDFFLRHVFIFFFSYGSSILRPLVTSGVLFPFSCRDFGENLGHPILLGGPKRGESVFYGGYFLRYGTKDKCRSQALLVEKASFYGRKVFSRRGANRRVNVHLTSASAHIARYCISSRRIVRRFITWRGLFFPCYRSVFQRRRSRGDVGFSVHSVRVFSYMVRGLLPSVHTSVASVQLWEVSPCDHVCLVSAARSSLVSCAFSF